MTQIVLVAPGVREILALLDAVLLRHVSHDILSFSYQTLLISTQRRYRFCVISYRRIFALNRHALRALAIARRGIHQPSLAQTTRERG